MGLCRTGTLDRSVILLKALLKAAPVLFSVFWYFRGRGLGYMLEKRKKKTTTKKKHFCYKTSQFEYLFVPLNKYRYKLV